MQDYKLFPTLYVTHVFTLLKNLYKKITGRTKGKVLFVCSNIIQMGLFFTDIKYIV
jgi:hypothetical protein